VVAVVTSTTFVRSMTRATVFVATTVFVKTWTTGAFVQVTCLV
jgi:hypothetical protein